ncbi:MAG: hypothetical protein MR425_07350 [Lachnospiraceae bacterium]|nr:hypothetical protein [Lachnospiraceae bacterium]
MGRLIIDGSQVYEIDEECIRKKKELERKRKTEAEKDRRRSGKRRMQE